MLSAFSDLMRRLKEVWDTSVLVQKTSYLKRTASPAGQTVPQPTFSASQLTSASRSGGAATDRTTVATVPTSRLVVPRSTARLVSSSAPTSIASTPPRSVMDSTIVGTLVTSRTATSTSASRTSSNVRLTRTSLPSVSHWTSNATRPTIVPEVRTRRVVPQRNVRSTSTSATIMPAFLTCGFVTATMIVETTAMSTALVFHRTGHVGTTSSSARAEGAFLHPGFATETKTAPSARTSPQVVSLPLKTLARLPISGASRESACLDVGAVIMRRTALMARMR